MMGQNQNIRETVTVPGHQTGHYYCSLSTTQMSKLQDVASPHQLPCLYEPWQGTRKGRVAHRQLLHEAGSASSDSRLHTRLSVKDEFTLK